ncbi:putative ABC transporter [Cyclospora cayetanensis]|uniref:ABC transporter n=1 Tax=Cyclospora cayetanensis TaxID=88456 RepID=A0A1D3D9X1_9EIME|nr:putative ABC transporter [Cyclospora cayetanensis]
MALQCAFQSTRLPPLLLRLLFFLLIFTCCFGVLPVSLHIHTSFLLRSLRRPIADSLGIASRGVDSRGCYALRAAAADPPKQGFPHVLQLKQHLHEAGEDDRAQGEVLLLEGVSVHADSAVLLDRVSLRLQRHEKLAVIAAARSIKEEVYWHLRQRQAQLQQQLKVQHEVLLQSMVKRGEKGDPRGKGRTEAAEESAAVLAAASQLSLLQEQQQEAEDEARWVSTVLHHVGFTEQQQQQPVSAASGDVLPLHLTPIEALTAAAATAERRAAAETEADATEGLDDSMLESKVLAALGRVGLRGPSLRVPLKQLSGGEKARVSFAMSILQAGSLGVLLLDEPSNHLDAAAAAALAAALRAFPGTVLLATHDPLFAAVAADKVLDIDPSTRSVRLRPAADVGLSEGAETADAAAHAIENTPHATAAAVAAWRRQWSPLFAGALAKQQQARRNTVSCGNPNNCSDGSKSDRSRRFGGSGVSCGRIKGVKNAKRWL